MDSQSPSAGTFFKEQALLIKDDFNLVLFFQERIFCSEEELDKFEYKIETDLSQEIPTYIGTFPQCKDVNADKIIMPKLNPLIFVLKKYKTTGFQ